MTLLLPVTSVREQYENLGVLLRKWQLFMAFRLAHVASLKISVSSLTHSFLSLPFSGRDYVSLPFPPSFLVSEHPSSIRHPPAP